LFIHHAAILDRSPLMIAFSSGGARRYDAHVARQAGGHYSHNYGRLAAFAKQFRRRVKARVTNRQTPYFLGDCTGWRGREKVLTGDEDSANSIVAADAGG